MTSPATPGPLVRFPRFNYFGDLNALSIVVQDLSLIYDITAIAVLPNYAYVRMPSTRLGPRRWSPLRAEDRLKVRRISFASPFEIAFYIAEYSAAIGGVAIAVNRVLLATKTFVDVLAAGVDVEQRRQALSVSREMMAHQLREAELRNALHEQELRSATARADLLESARDEILGHHGHWGPAPRRGSLGGRSAGSLTTMEFAELLDEPVLRMLGYGGGELEVAGDNPNPQETD